MGRPALPNLRDAVAPMAVAILATIEAVSLDPPRVWVAIAIEWAACLPLVLRRRLALTAGTAALAATTLLAYLGPGVSELAAPILIIVLAVYSLGRYLRDMRGLAVVGLFLVVILTAYPTTDPADVTDVVFVSAIGLPPYGFGRIMRALDERNTRLLEQAELLALRQEVVKREAVVAERARIARELHDVIAHSVSAMVVQAAAARDLVRTDPDRAVTALEEVSGAGRRALAETGRLLHLIRDTDDDLGLEPDLGLDRLPQLVEGFRRSGLNVELAVDGDLARLPAGVDLSGYRIVQESLTNALKYASDRTACLHVTRGPTGLSIRTENRGNPENGGGGGLGLVGIAERVSVFGGSLTHEFTGDGRFVLCVTLPLGRGEP